MSDWDSRALWLAWPDANVHPRREFDEFLHAPSPAEYAEKAAWDIEPAADLGVRLGWGQGAASLWKISL